MASIRARMTDAMQIRRAEIPQQPGAVTRQGGDLRILDGADHGLHTSVMQSVIAPGGGPRRHRHPHAEVFVFQDGTGSFEVDGKSFDAEAGDLLIVPPNAWHGFANTGSTPLRLVAIHENPRAVIEWEDGSRRD
jgi:quercetin dioxygenase-like cupin family protein